ncbi:hypothetical protein N9T15_00710 [Pelagibacteraceae bacterium]|nr:hypothetical protein [Pelagibacteraceae bacterium]
MGIFIKQILKILIYIVLICSWSKLLFCNQINLNAAKQEFVNGNYDKSILLASKINTAEAMIFLSRTISIYTNFFKNGEKAKESYMKAYNISKKALSISENNTLAYTEAAHALGRYGQEIGIMSAITEGIATRVKTYLDKALGLDDNNIIANLSKGLWHAEIVNQAGHVLARGMYGAKSETARMHFTKVINLNSNDSSDDIAILYELSYGYLLSGEKKDLEISKAYIEKLLKINSISHIDNLYKKKAKKLSAKIASLS